MRTTARILVLAVLAAAGVLLAPRAGALTYTFTTIALSGPTHESFETRPALNDAGTVAFGATLAAGGNGIFTGSGGAITTIAQSGPTFTNVLGSAPSINADGTVAFEAQLAGGSGLFTGSGGAVATVVDNSGFFGASFTFFGRPSLNDVGSVAFSAQLTNDDEGIYFKSPILLIPISIASVVEPGEADHASLNGVGAVAYLESAPLPVPSASIRRLDAGGTTTIASGSPALPVTFGTLGMPSLNDAGTVAFRASLGAGGSGIFTGSGGATTAIADSTGPFTTFDTPSLDSAGKVAFWAELDAGGSGIFLGPNPVADKVIRTGDPLAGSTVTALDFFLEGLNDGGSLAFWASLADGRTGVFRADLVPEPSSAALLACGLASLALAARRRRGG